MNEKLNSNEPMISDKINSIKRKLLSMGVRDLYLVKIARIGNKAEIPPECEDEEPRLVFELEYLDSLKDYKMITLNYLRTYTDTVLGRVYDEGTNNQFS